MKKNGFISISVVYSFFFIFLLLLLFVLNNMINDRILISKIKNKVKEEISDTNFSRYLIKNSGESLVYHDYSLEYGARDLSYRFTGANPNNYVCLKETCSNDDDLYQIIGIIDGKVKLIKHTALISDVWSNGTTNEYNEAKIDTYLNNTYLNSLGDNINKLINVTEWHTAGFSELVGGGILNKKTYEIYEYELGINMNNGIWINKKVALPYISDYAFATPSSNYNTSISKNNNWMFLGNLWTISRNTNYINQAYYIDNNGLLKTDVITSVKNIKPVFFLKGSVVIKGGNGTKNNPYKVGE